MSAELVWIVLAGLAVGGSLGGLGGGGSILAVPALVYLLGQSVPTATTGSLVIVGTSAAVGAISHHRAGTLRPRLGPVSYTHLDVYKRQAFSTALAIAVLALATVVVTGVAVLTGRAALRGQICIPE